MSTATQHLNQLVNGMSQAESRVKLEDLIGIASVEQLDRIYNALESIDGSLDLLNKCVAGVWGAINDAEDR